MLPGAHESLGMTNTGGQSAAALKNVVESMPKGTKWVIEIAGQCGGILDMKTHTQHRMFLKIFPNADEGVVDSDAHGRQLPRVADT